MISLILDWKKTVQKVEITCLVAGLVGMFLLLLSSVTNKLVTLSGVCRLWEYASVHWQVSPGLFSSSSYIFLESHSFSSYLLVRIMVKKVYFAIKSDCMLRKTLSFPLKLLNSLTFKLLTDDKLQQVSYVPQVHTMVKCSLCRIKTGFRFFNTFYEIF